MTACTRSAGGTAGSAGAASEYPVSGSTGTAYGGCGAVSGLAPATCGRGGNDSASESPGAGVAAGMLIVVPCGVARDGGSMIGGAGGAAAGCAGAVRCAAVSRCSSASMACMTRSYVASAIVPDCRNRSICRAVACRSVGGPAAGPAGCFVQPQRAHEVASGASKTPHRGQARDDSARAGWLRPTSSRKNHATPSHKACPTTATIRSVIATAIRSMNPSFTA